MSLSGLVITVGEKNYDFSEQEIKAILKYFEFHKEQKNSREWEKVPKQKDFGFTSVAKSVEAQPEFVTLVDPYGSLFWDSICIGFLAAEGIRGDRCSLISNLISNGDVDLHLK